MTGKSLSKINSIWVKEFAIKIILGDQSRHEKNETLRKVYFTPLSHITDLNYKGDFGLSFKSQIVNTIFFGPQLKVSQDNEDIRSLFFSRPRAMIFSFNFCLM